MSRVLVVFVDALGPSQLERLSRELSFDHAGRELAGVLGYSSGALATLLTGSAPSEHGRMCLFAHAAPGGDLLKPLSLLGLLPRWVHERAAVRRVGAKCIAAIRGLRGYVALHKVPPQAFEWLDLPERDDLFEAKDIGGRSTFLSQARAAGLRVQAARWQLPERERFVEIESRVSTEGGDLVFAYAAGLDAVLHREGNGGPSERAALRTIARHVDALRGAMAKGGDVTTILVGDHGMADVTRVVDPRPITDRLDARFFVDSTFLRVWGDDRQLGRARAAVERAGWPATWLDRDALRSREAPMVASPYGDAFAVLDEGAIFAPSFVGGVARGMHGYDLGTGSSRAAIASDREIPGDVASLADVSSLVVRALGVS